jgi:hypothetical protein
MIRPLAEFVLYFSSNRGGSSLTHLPQTALGCPADICADPQVRPIGVTRDGLSDEFLRDQLGMRAVVWIVQHLRFNWSTSASVTEVLV